LQINNPQTQKPMNNQNSENNVSEHNPSDPTAANLLVAESTPTELPLAENPPPPERIAESPSFSPGDLHARAGSLLSRLTDTQQSQLFQWLREYTISTVLGFVAAPPPVGFGIQTHKTTLRRIKAVIGSHDPSVALENSAAAAEFLTETIQENRPQFAPLISELLLQRAFDQAADTTRDHGLKDLINSAIKLRELELKVQRLQLLREKQQATARRSTLRIHVNPPTAK
jgi:hypothetical protein